MIDTKPNNTKVTPTSILWFLLTLCVVIILGMTAAWANGIEKREIQAEARIGVLEQQFGTVVAQLQDLRESQKKMDNKLDRILEK